MDGFPRSFAIYQEPEATGQGCADRAHGTGNAKNADNEDNHGADRRQPVRFCNGRGSISEDAYSTKLEVGCNECYRLNATISVVGLKKVAPTKPPSTRKLWIQIARNKLGIKSTSLRDNDGIKRSLICRRSCFSRLLVLPYGDFRNTRHRTPNLATAKTLG